MNSTEAKRTVSDLEAKLATATSRAVELQTDRRRLAFDANVGDATARKALDKANASSATADLEIENITTAVDEANRRLAIAVRDEETAATRHNAKQAAEIGGQIAERGKRIDEAFEIVRVELKDMLADFDKLHSLGLANPHAQQLKVLGGLAVTTALMGLPIKPAERDQLAPRERKTFSEISNAWQDAIARWASMLSKDEAAAYGVKTTEAA